jgi:hypothetical protein
VLLSKINVLDHGYVGLLSTGCTGKTIKAIEDLYFKAAINREFWKMANATFIMKVPLFVQVFLSQFDLKLTPLHHQEEPVAYVPDESEINSGTNDDDREIVKHMKDTVDSLFITSKAYQQDKCDKFLSHIVTPISVYNEIVVHGDLRSWLELLRRKKLPKPIEAYRSAIEELLKVEWKDIELYKKEKS